MRNAKFAGHPNTEAERAAIEALPVLDRVRAVPKLLLSVMVLVVLSFSAAGRADEPRRYDGFKIVRIEVQDQAELETIESLGGNILNCVSSVGPMDVLVSGDQLGLIEQRGLRFQIQHEDVQGLIDRERAAPVVAAAGDPFQDFFLAYHPYGAVDMESSILWYMNELVTRYPTLVTWTSVGTTVEGRTIWGLRVSGPLSTDKAAVVYFGCEHAREWITTTIPTYFANYLAGNYGTDATVTNLMDRAEFFLVPVFNLDGYLYTWSTNRFWRKNRRPNGGASYGVDLNRNWAEGWGGPGSSADPNSDGYHGPVPFSEPETQGLRNFLTDHTNVRAQLDIHSYSQLILWPYGYTNSFSPDQSTYQLVGNGMQADILGVHGKYYAAGPVYSTIYPASGVSVDWTYAQLNILSFSFEVRDTGTYGFLLPPDQIIPNNEELLPAVLRLSGYDWLRSALAPVATAEGARYLSITPAGGGSDVALRVASPDYPCLQKYATSTGGLSDSPEVHAPGAWGTIHVTGAEIVPATTYEVRSDYGAGRLSAGVSVTTAVWADVVAPIGLVDFSDVSAVVDCFKGLFVNPLERCDLQPQVPDHLVDFADVSEAVNAFKGLPYPFSVPCP